MYQDANTNVRNLYSKLVVVLNLWNPLKSVMCRAVNNGVLSTLAFW